MENKKDSLSDLHSNDHDDTEIYNDAAVKQAMQDFLNTEGEDTLGFDEKAFRRSMRFNNITPNLNDDDW
jgi:hypothetical protein